MQVLHTIPVGGDDRGGTAWSRVVPRWFGDWVLRRDTVPHEVVDVARLSLGVHYEKPVAAARFLAEAFGFGPVDELPEAEHDPDVGYGYHWIEFRLGSSALNVFPIDGPRAGSRTHLPWIYVDDLDAHYAQAKASGATIIEEPHPFPGERRVRRGRSGGQPLALLPGPPHPALALPSGNDVTRGFTDGRLGKRMGAMDTPDTVTEAVAFLAKEGYVEDYRLCPEGIVAAGHEGSHPTTTAVVDHTFRFEGPSDPGRRGDRARRPLPGVEQQGRDRRRLRARRRPRGSPDPHRTDAQPLARHAAVTWSAVADVVVVAHLAYLVFVAVGGILAWRWPRLIWFHVAAVIWSVSILVVGQDCPLTDLQRLAERRAGEPSMIGASSIATSRACSSQSATPPRSAC